MPGLLLVLIGGAGLFWAWRTGRLSRFNLDDGVALIAFLLGLRLLTTGRPLIGAVAMAGAILWAAYRRKRAARDVMPPSEARKLLGVSDTASLDEIRAAHRRLMARVHPDIGGSEELATRVNRARDVLVSEMNRRTPRA